jgi:hypothetical protein
MVPYQLSLACLITFIHTNLVKEGMASEVRKGMASEIREGMASEFREGMASEVKEGMASEVKEGMASEFDDHSSNLTQLFHHNTHNIFHHNTHNIFHTSANPSTMKNISCPVSPCLITMSPVAEEEEEGYRKIVAELNLANVYPPTLLAPPLPIHCHATVFFTQTKSG